MENMRTLGIDPGKKRVGVAVSDPGGTIAHPLKVLQEKNRAQFNGEPGMDYLLTSPPYLQVVCFLELLERQDRLEFAISDIQSRLRK